MPRTMNDSQLASLVAAWDVDTLAEEVRKLRSALLTFKPDFHRPGCPKQGATGTIIPHATCRCGVEAIWKKIDGAVGG